ncbi:heat shock 70 kDa protein 12B [Diplogelasinospora grovesii]|uniref:Heat shock 70 kDa protein 12B n=1 Tax=Diplogelasinospora grovesii TaxID=303347 RepID=A0AAN6S184_9PEZI|nr:heat shock 70 kDa protein 12B [Diplogelasinospora grovesii]
MDPLSIAASAAGLATGCSKIVSTLYTWIDDTIDVDENVAGLCEEVTALARVLESVSNASIKAPRVVIAEIDPDESLWITVKATLGDIKSTLDKVNQLLAEIQNSSGVFARGFFRKPAKQIRFTMRSKDITLYKDRIKSYNNAMTSALQMINVCLLIQNNSSQDAVFRVLTGLKSQIGRVEDALHAGPPVSREEDDRISRNLQQFVRVAESFHSSASTIVREGPRSTVWGGSILGDPLTEEQFSSIEGWIPPPINEQEELVDEPSGASNTGQAGEQAHHSDSDDDMDKDLVERLGELALHSELAGDYAKAENFYRRVINRKEARQSPAQDIPTIRLKLAYTCLRQEKWAEVEIIIRPIAWEKTIADLEVYDWLHALALVHMKNSDFGNAYGCCKRALWGKRKIIGKDHPSCWETLALLASICNARNDAVEAEAHQSFIPISYPVHADKDPLTYLNRKLDWQPPPPLPTTTRTPPVSRQGLGQTSQRYLASTPRQYSTPPTDASLVPPPMAPNHSRSPSPLPQASTYFLDPRVTPNQSLPTPPPQQAYVPRPRAQLIVGIHYGAEQTAVAFAFTTNTEAKEDIITEWPGLGSYTRPTIPTLLYYDQYQKVVGWGPDIADALAPTGYPKPGVQKVEWFTLQLMLEGNTYIDPLNLPPLPDGKTAICVSADYLSKLRQAIRSALQKTLGEVFLRQERSIRWVFTIPATWNDAGKAALRESVIDAGFIRDPNDNRLQLVTEPEAIVFFCSKTGLLNIKLHDAVLIVDAGKGTVDLIAYEVQDANPFTVAEVTAASGDSCGSTALNRNFSNMLRAKLRKMRLPEGSKTVGRVYAKAIMDFENRIKGDFRNNGQNWAVDVGIESEWPEAGIEDGYMTFTNEAILQCFEPVINRVLELVQNQVIAVQAQNRILQSIIVTGEFGKSEYLFQQMKIHVPPQLQSRVVQPMDAQSAIVKGAVTAGIADTRLWSYGDSPATGLPTPGYTVMRSIFVESQPYPSQDIYRHERDMQMYPDGQYRNIETTQRIIQAGQLVQDKQQFEVNLAKYYSQPIGERYDSVFTFLVFRDRIFSKKQLPDSNQGMVFATDPRCQFEGGVTADFSRQVPDSCFRKFYGPSGPYYLVEYQLRCTVHAGLRVLELQSFFQGKPMGDIHQVKL